MTDLLPDPTDARTFERTPPHDIAAEQCVLGAIMLSAAAAETTCPMISSGDFYRPAHQITFETIQALRTSGQPADVMTVHARLQTDGRLTQAGGAPYLHTLIAQTPTAANASYYAAIVRERAVRRRLIEAGMRLTQMGYACDGEEAHGITERALREVERVRDFGASEDLTTLTVDEFLAAPDDAYDWIVPGLLERGDRLVLTGVEGLGKSTLFRQVAVSIAAGLHPFTHAPITPRRVLVIDCENGHTHTRRKLRPLVAQAARDGHPVPEANLWIELRPEGMDLAADRDTSWLLRRVTVLNPDVVLIGPLYRLAPRALNTDDDAAPVIATLNMIRARGACVLLEAHAGHAMGSRGQRDLRPRGSSAFLGWPEFGYGIRLADHPDARARRRVEFSAWRGDRDERHWPEQLQTSPAWPWVEAAPA